MQRLYRLLAQPLGLIRDPAAPAGSAERPLRVLLLASFLLPVVLLALASAISYREHFEDARDRLNRNLNRITEHATKVFETFELSSLYLDQLLKGTSDDEIRRNEQGFSQQLKIVATSLPQLRDLWVVDAEGRPVVSGTIYPMPALDVSDRDYFLAQKNKEVTDTYISGVLSARVGASKFFVISRRRETAGRFAGVTIVSIAPEYFAEYYSQLPVSENNSAALIRRDGTVLARYPDLPNAPEKLPPNGAFMQELRAHPDKGSVTSRSSFDGVERTFAYRKLPRYEVYVVASFSTASVLETWLTAMSRHLIFGIPATLALIGLSVVALHRTQRLEREVARREATENALRQSQKMEAVGRLSGGIAHDFNNMLTVIMGNIDMALRRIEDKSFAEQPGRMQRLLDSARQASERAAMLVQRLLAFSRQHPQEVKAVDLNRLVQSMSELLRRTIGETITIETVLAGGLWRIAVDPNQLENAIVNLAVNARDAMPEGGRLTIETVNAYLDEPYAAAHADEVVQGQYVMVAISDTGSGMSREVVEQAFEPFFTTKPIGMGTGLGLSMVYGFAKQSGGHVKIYSEIGEGTTIKLYFPRLNEQRAVPAWTNEERAMPRPAARAKAAETILLVEDDADVRGFGTDVLRDHGYQVLIAGDAAGALKVIATETKIDLLFTDVVLPGGMNGRQLATEAAHLRPSLKVLHATGYTRNAIIHHGRLDADVELLTKPFSADALLRKVRQMLDGQQTRTPAGPPN